MARWRIAERFGWTLDVIDNMSIADLHELIQIDDGIEKARPKPKANDPRSRTNVRGRRGRR